MRLLSLVVALLLAASSLSQVAHFLLVPHAFCAEHGELLELSSSPTELSHAAPDAGHEASVVAVDAEDGHDHCQLLARSQREQLLPPVPAFELPALVATTPVVLPADAATSVRQLACLDSAPKTSPPGLLG